MPEQDLTFAFVTLECEPGCSSDEVKASYRQLVKVWHPDRFQGDDKLKLKATEKLKLINEAYHLLQGHFDSRAKDNECQSEPTKVNVRSELMCKDMLEEDGPVPKTPEQMDAEKRMAKAGFSMEVSDGAINRMIAFSKKKGIDATIDLRWPAKGSAFLPQGLKRVRIIINPTKITLDALNALFQGHAYMHLLRNSPYASDRALIANYEQLVNASGVVERLNADRQKLNLVRVKNGWKPLISLDVGQYMALQQGVEGIMRDPAMSGEGEWSGWFGDFKGRMKGIIGNANEKEIRRVIDYKWHNDPFFEDYFPK